MFAAATEEEIQSLWDDVRKIDGPLEPTDTTKVLTKGKRELQEFMQSHSEVRHYMFSVKNPSHFVAVHFCVHSGNKIIGSFPAV